MADDGDDGDDGEVAKLQPSSNLANQTQPKGPERSSSESHSGSDFASSSPAAAGFLHRNGVHHQTLRQNPHPVVPESTQQTRKTRPPNRKKSAPKPCGLWHTTISLAFFLLTTHALVPCSLAGSADDGGPLCVAHKRSTLFDSSLVVYTPFMLLTLALDLTHTNAALLAACCFPPIIASMAFVITLQSSCCCCCRRCNTHPH